MSMEFTGPTMPPRVFSTGTMPKSKRPSRTASKTSENSRQGMAAALASQARAATSLLAPCSPWKPTVLGFLSWMARASAITALQSSPVNSGLARQRDERVMRSMIDSSLAGSATSALKALASNAFSMRSSTSERSLASILSMSSLMSLSVMIPP